MGVHLDFEILDDGNYRLLSKIRYHSPRYDKWVTVPVDYISDGASGPAEDIVSEAWWVHDVLCDRWAFDDKTPCSNRQASLVLHDILKSEGRWFRSRSWFLATWWGGPVTRLWDRMKKRLPWRR